MTAVWAALPALFVLEINRPLTQAAYPFCISRIGFFHNVGLFKRSTGSVPYSGQ